MPVNVIRTTAMRQRSTALALTLTFLPWIATTGGAYEYSAGYRVEGGFAYNDNEGMDTDDKDETSAANLNLPVTLTARSERMSANLLAEASTSKYNNSG